MPEVRWQGLEVVEVVERIGSEAFVGRIDLTKNVFGTITGSSSAAVSTPCILGSPRSYLVVVAAVVVAGNFAHIAERIGATVGSKNCSGCSFGHMYPTLAGYLRKCNKMPSDLG